LTRTRAVATLWTTRAAPCGRARRGHLKSITALVAAAIAVLAIAGGALGGSPDGAAGPWADTVVRFVQGPRLDGTKIDPSRSDAATALGPAEAAPGNDDPIPTGKFVSMGFGGQLTLGFQNPICNGPGLDMAIDVREITKAPYPPEVADVYVSGDGATWTKAGTITGDAQVAVPKTIPMVWFVAFVDVTDHNRFTLAQDADGYDIDGVSALDATSCSGTPPVPAAGWGDPLANTPPPTTTTVKCTPSYWKNPHVVGRWPVKQKALFDTTFGVKTFPKESLLQALYQNGGGTKAVGREGVLSLLTSMTPGSGYPYKAGTVKKLVKTALSSKAKSKAKVWASTIKKLGAARARGACPRPI
jgi:hypothetical protein